MIRCVHCGSPAAGEYPLGFEREEETREMELTLCEGCLGSFEKSEDVRRLD